MANRLPLEWDGCQKWAAFTFHFVYFYTFEFVLPCACIMLTINKMRLEENSKLIKKFLPGSNPRFGVRVETTSPAAMFVRRWRQKSPFRGQLLCNCPDVVGLKSTAPTYVPDPQVVGLSGIFLNIPSGCNSGLQCCNTIVMALLLPSLFSNNRCSRGIFFFR